MSLRLSFITNLHITTIGAYAPTMTNLDDTKDNFYENPDSLIESISRKGIIGSNGVGKCNSNRLLLLKTCAEHSLQITNTFFRLGHRIRATRMYLRSCQ